MRPSTPFASLRSLTSSPWRVAAGVGLLPLLVVLLAVWALGEDARSFLARFVPRVRVLTCRRSALRPLGATRLLASALVVVMLVPMLPRVAWADDGAVATSGGASSLGMPESGGGAAAGDLASIDPSTGEVHMSYAFELPPARGRVQPSLGLSYGSSGGDGEAGNWRLSLPTIERHAAAGSGAPTFRDPPTTYPAATSTVGMDRFTASGAELVPVCLAVPDYGCKLSSVFPGATDGPSNPFYGWSIFRAEVEHGPPTAYLWSPDHFRWMVVHADGTWQEFSDVEKVPLPNALLPGIQRWRLTREYDAHRTANGNPSNPILYIWQSDGNGGLELRDEYDTPGDTPAANGGYNWAHHVHFTYEPQPFPKTNLVRWRATPIHRLTTVDVTSQDISGGARAMVRRYHLTYDADTLYGHPHHSYLKSITLEGRCAPSSASVTTAGNVLENADGSLPATSCPSAPPTTFSYTGAFFLSQKPKPLTGLDSLLTPATECHNDANIGVCSGCPAATMPDLGQCHNVGTVPWCKCVQANVNVPMPVNELHAASVVDFNSDGWPDLLVPAVNGRKKQLLCTNHGGGAFTCDGDVTALPLVSDPKANVGGIFTGDFNNGDGALNWLVVGTAPGETERAEDALQTYSILTPVLNAGTAHSYTLVTARTGQWNWFTGPQGWRLNERPQTTSDVDGDGLTDLLTFRSATGWKGYSDPPGNSTGYGVSLTTKTGSGFIVPFNRPSQLKIEHSDMTGWVSTDPRLTSTQGPVWARSLAYKTLADMNGDGLVDVVALARTPFDATSGGSLTLRYWPGYGDGRFGTQVAGTDGSVRLGGVPSTLDPSTTKATFHDLNGDGLADLVTSTSTEVRVYVNLDGTQFNATPWVLLKASDFPDLWGSAEATLTFADMDGSGIDDLVLIDSKMGYFDPIEHETRAGLLTTIDNGVGGTTSISYESIARLDKAAVGTPYAWTTHSPQNMHVATSITTSNGLSGTQKISRTTAYAYRNPGYDARSRQFHGFETVTVTRGGDSVSTGTETVTTFLLGQCPIHDIMIGTGPDYVPTCAVTADHPWNALRGLPVVVETRVPGGVFPGTLYGTQHTRYRVSQSATGLDGRIVRSVFPDQVDTYAPDPTATSSGTSTDPFVSDVVLSAADDNTLLSPRLRTLTFRNVAGMAHLRKTIVRDAWGRPTLNTDYGRVTGDFPKITPADPILVTSFTYYTPPGALAGLLSKVRTTNTGAGDASGNLIDSGRTKTFDYNAAGDLTDESMTPSGTVALSRSGNVAVPDTASAVAPHVVKLVHTDIDPVYGFTTQRTTPNSGLEVFVFDPVWHEYVTSRTTRTGTKTTGFSSLTSTASYDVGLGRTIAEVDASGAMSTTTFDGLNRPIATAVPDALTPTVPVAMTTTEYLPVVSGVRRVHVTRKVAIEQSREAWTYLDGLGTRLALLTTADPGAGDGGTWSVGGLTEWSPAGLPAKLYAASFSSLDPRTQIPTPPGGAAFTSSTFDALGRTLTTKGLDGSLLATTVYHALSTEVWDAEDLDPKSTHYNTPTVTTFDGHGRPTAVTETSKTPAASSATTSFDYLGTGELSKLTRTYDKGTYAGGGQGTYVRTMAYDSFGRVVQNIEPNTSTTVGSLVKAHAYAYDDAGNLVASADARGCGANFFYDAAGRKFAEDYVPCTSDQPAYTAPDLHTGDGTEAFYRYDTGEPDQTPDVAASMWKGRLVSIRDRAAHTRFNYDGRGHVVQTSRQIATPDTTPALATRYAPHWFERTAQFDFGGRIATESTGADVVELQGVNRTSTVSTFYSKRGAVKQVWSDYGSLLSGMAYDADGALLTETLGDVGATTSKLTYGNGATKRLTHSTLTRGATNVAGVSTPVTTLSDVGVSYDRVGNPLTITEAASPFDTILGAKSVSRTLSYDDRYRVTGITYDSKGDSFTNPAPGFAAAAPVTASAKRVASQAFEYDGLGNLIKTADDANTFFDRSLGVETHSPGTNRLTSAGSTATNGGTLAPQYDVAGNMTSLTVNRTKACLSGATCKQVVYSYAWDEVGNLARASRSDDGGGANTLAYTYDAGGARVTTARANTIFVMGAPHEDVHYNVEIFPSLRLNSASLLYDSATGTLDYERTPSTETVYLVAGGASLARLVYATADSTTQASGTLHVFFELGDMLGSTSFVIDKDTSDVVEKRTYQAFGSVDSEYQSSKWAGFREQYGFTGKELDLEVGLTYFGARYYSAELGRFISPDPLTLHALGADLNPYAYVGGRVATHTDPLGLRARSPVGSENDGTAATISTADSDRVANGGEANYNDGRVSCDSDGNCAINGWEVVVVGQAEGAGIPTDPELPPAGDVGSSGTGVGGGDGGSGSGSGIDDSRDTASFFAHHETLMIVGGIVVAAGIIALTITTFGVGAIALAGVEAIGGAMGTALSTMVAAAEAGGAMGGGLALAGAGGGTVAVSAEAVVAAQATAAAVTAVAMVAVNAAARSGSRGSSSSSGPRNGHLAGKSHPVTEVPFDESGHPDFKKAGLVKAEVKIEQTGTRAGDFRAANKAAGFSSTPENMTWHHHQDGTTMQLVPSDIHAATGHTGGFVPR